MARRGLPADPLVRTVGRGQLDLFVDHSLNRNLAGSAAANRGDHRQSIRSNRYMAVSGWFGARAVLRLGLEGLQRLFPEFVEFALEEAKGVWVGQSESGLCFCRPRLARPRARPG